MVTRTIRLLVGAAFLATAVGAQQPKFYRDDPLQRDPDTQDASKVQSWDIPLIADLVTNLFSDPGDPATNVRAQNINTADEVPDSSWFTNRIYSRAVTIDEISRGPNTMGGPAPGKWTIIRGKSAGVSPGFTVRDEKGEVWFLNFDGKGNPIAPSAAATIATKLFWALGYHQVETYVATIRPENIDIDPKATINEHGQRRAFNKAHLKAVLARAARNEDGSYRLMAGRAVPGRPIGGFRYFGTRPDDPNDVVPHEHRRELRALKVFGAWTNLVDMKAGNTLDTVITENGRATVRHYLQDVGSTFGTGALNAREGDEGYEEVVDLGATFKRLVTMGLYIRPWQTVDYQDHPQVGLFEAELFDPEKWTPRVSAAPLRHTRADDEFWAALRVMAFTDDQIRAAVKQGAYTDPGAEEMLSSLLIKRRDKIGRTYFSKINPLTRFALSDSGELTFENPAVRAGFDTTPAKGYEAVWARFDNTTQQAQPISTVTAPGDRGQAPTLPTDTGSFVKVSIRALESTHPSWTVPVDVYFRRDGGRWTLVGVERLK
jgi:hypothetical protein